MQALAYDLVVTVGSTFEFFIGLLSSSGALDLTNYKARSQMREDYSSIDAFLSFTTDNSSIILDPTAGTLKMSASDIQTALIKAESGVWDMELVSPAGKVYQIMYGKVIIHPEATRINNEA
jgi:hypothetical protein